MKKKLLALALCLSVSFGLMACGGAKVESTESTDNFIFLIYHSKYPLYAIISAILVQKYPREHEKRSQGLFYSTIISVDSPHPLPQLQKTFWLPHQNIHIPEASHKFQSLLLCILFDKFRYTLSSYLSIRYSQFYLSSVIVL